MDRQMMNDAIRREMIKHTAANLNIGDIDPSKIYDLWVNNKFSEPMEEMEFSHFAIYYNHVKKNYSLAEKFYLLAIDKGNVDAMVYLAILYKNITNNYELAAKYYLMAIDNGHIDAIHGLGNMYLHKIKNLDLAKKYLRMASDAGDGDANNDLISTYEMKNELTEALHYFSDKSLGWTLTIIEKIITKNIKLDEYFFKSIPNLKKIEDRLPETIKTIIKLYTKDVDVLENSFKYAPNEYGYTEALEDYQSRLVRQPLHFV